VATSSSPVSKRPHRRRFDALEAEQIIADLAGIEFDPQVAKKLVALLAKDRGLQEVSTPIATTEIEREPQQSPVVMQPAIVAAEYQPEPDILETYPIAAQADPQIVGLAPDPEDRILLIDEPETVLIVEPETIVSEERVKISTPLPDPPILEESDTAVWAESPEAPPDIQTVIVEAGDQESEPLESEKQKQ
jgi:hypothetical protein